MRIGQAMGIPLKKHYKPFDKFQESQAADNALFSTMKNTATSLKHGTETAME